jgi:hypothetical protein
LLFKIDEVLRSIDRYGEQRGLERRGKSSAEFATRRVHATHAHKPITYSVNRQLAVCRLGRAPPAGQEPVGQEKLPSLRQAYKTLSCDQLAAVCAMQRISVQSLSSILPII